MIGSSLIRLTAPSAVPFLFLYPAQIEIIFQTIIILPAPAGLQLPLHDPTDHVSPKPGSSSGNT